MSRHENPCPNDRELAEAERFARALLSALPGLAAPEPAHWRGAALLRAVPRVAAPEHAEWQAAAMLRALPVVPAPAGLDAAWRGLASSATAGDDAEVIAALAALPPIPVSEAADRALRAKLQALSAARARALPAGQAGAQSKAAPLHDLDSWRLRFRERALRVGERVFRGSRVASVLLVALGATVVALSVFNPRREPGAGGPETMIAPETTHAAVGTPDLVTEAPPPSSLPANDIAPNRAVVDSGASDDSHAVMVTARPAPQAAQRSLSPMRSLAERVVARGRFDEGTVARAFAGEPDVTGDGVVDIADLLLGDHVLLSAHAMALEAEESVETPPEPLRESRRRLERVFAALLQ